MPWLLVEKMYKVYFTFYIEKNIKFSQVKTVHGFLSELHQTSIRFSPEINTNQDQILVPSKSLFHFQWFPRVS
jgi:hypothetical protein